jgi:dTMP kinase
MPGTFIVLEGPDGSGTTTHAFLLAERLRNKGENVVLTEEPTEGEHGVRVRRAIGGEEWLEPAEIQELFCLDRRQHVEEIIRPNLEAGVVLICDRYIPSTIVYGEASGVDRALLEQWNEGFPEPDVTIFTMAPFETCWERVRERGTEDIFEKEEFLRKVHEGYERYAEEHPEVRVVDTSGRAQDGAEEVFEIVRGTIGA